MSHDRGNSGLSTALSTLTLSDFSDNSEDFSSNVTKLIEDKIRTTQEYDTEAGDLISRFFNSNQDPNILVSPTIDSAFDSSLILRTMLTSAKYYCSDNSWRYTACAIIACKETRVLMDLAGMWIRYLLWPFKANTDVRGYHDANEVATPTRGTTLETIVNMSPTRKLNFATEVLERDGGRCVVTKWSHPTYQSASSGPVVFTRGTHILKRTVAVHGSQAHEPTVSTWDMIKNYGDLTLSEMAHIVNTLIDDPSNGMTLSGDAHSSFDKFKWTLVAQPGQPNTYKVKFFGGSGWIPVLPSEIITFKDNSPNRNRAVPNPKFIALHCAIAHVLHMSGAGEVIDKIIDRYAESGAAIPSASKIRTQEDLDIFVSAMHL